MTGILYNERLFTKASIRILLSDTAADITNIPGIGPGAPVNLETNWNVAANVPAGPPVYGPLSLFRPPIAMSTGARKTTVTAVAGTTITPAALNTFAPTFTLGGNANVITCTTKANLKLSGCTGAPLAMTATAGQTLTQMSPAGNSSGISGPTTSTTAAGVINFVNNTARDVFNFAPMPFWDVNMNPPALVTCTGMTATTYTGCTPTPSNGDTLVSGYMSDAGVSTLGGFIKIERNNADNSGWTDITTEILNYGIGDTNANNNDAVYGLGGTGASCGTTAVIAPNAIIRLQRLRDNSGTCTAPNGSFYSTVAGGALDPTNWWPNVLFDSREGLFRDSNYPGAAQQPDSAAA